jgi:hypothetical protein
MVVILVNGLSSLKEIALETSNISKFAQKRVKNYEEHLLQNLVWRTS